MAFFGNSYFGGLFAPVGNEYTSMPSNQLGNTMPQNRMGLLGSSGFMPSISPYQSAITLQGEPGSEMLQYNPITQLPEIPRPDPFGFFTQQPAQQQQNQLQQPVTQDVQDYVQEALQRHQRGSRQNVPVHRGRWG